MAVGKYGQMVTFESAGAVTGQMTPYKWVRTNSRYNTCSWIARKYGGDASLASVIVSLNGNIKLGRNHFLNNPRTILPEGTRLRLPAWMADPNNPDLTFSTYLQDMAPITVGDGYAMFDTVARPAALSFTRFLGYDGIQLNVPLHFEGFADEAGEVVESRIQVLEALAGRGIKADNAGQKPPPPIKVYALDGKGRSVPVVPSGFGWTPTNPTSPIYYINGIAWSGGDLRDAAGRRVRSECTVTLIQGTGSAGKISAAARSRQAKNA